MINRLSSIQVVPMPWDATYAELDYLITRLSGILFTGGDSELYLDKAFTYNKLTDTASFIMYKIIMQNKAGNTYPLMGTC
jgi:gamma-glutamyl hydrolase